MPRTLQEILDHADELADRFEAYEPDEGDRVSVDEIADRRLRQAAVARAHAERQVADAVKAARANGISWRRIGESLGTSAQATQKRYAILVGKAKANLARSRATTAGATPTRSRSAAGRTKVARRTGQAR
jgi:FAD/FMN-containing dehydrogenase